MITNTVLHIYVQTRNQINECSNDVSSSRPRAQSNRFGLFWKFLRLLQSGAGTVRDVLMACQGDVHGEEGGSLGKDPEPIIEGVLGCAFVPFLTGRNEAAAFDGRAAWDGGRVDQLDREPKIQDQLRREVILLVPEDLAVGHAGEQGDESALDLVQLSDVSLGNHATASGLFQNRVDNILADLSLGFAVHEDRHRLVLCGGGWLVLDLVLFLALLFSHLGGAWTDVRVVHVIQHLNLEVKIIPIMLGLCSLDPGRGEPAHAPVVCGEVLALARVPPVSSCNTRRS